MAEQRYKAVLAVIADGRTVVEVAVLELRRMQARGAGCVATLHGRPPAPLAQPFEPEASTIVRMALGDDHVPSRRRRWGRLSDAPVVGS